MFDYLRVQVRANLMEVRGCSALAAWVKSISSMTQPCVVQVAIKLLIQFALEFNF